MNKSIARRLPLAIMIIMQLHMLSMWWDGRDCGVHIVLLSVMILIYVWRLL